MHENHGPDATESNPPMTLPESAPRAFPGTESHEETSARDPNPAPATPGDGRNWLQELRKVPSSWELRFKVAMVASFLILVAVLVANRSRHKADPSEKESTRKKVVAEIPHAEADQPEFHEPRELDPPPLPANEPKNLASNKPNPEEVPKVPPIEDTPPIPAKPETTLALNEKKNGEGIEKDAEENVPPKPAAPVTPASTPPLDDFPPTPVPAAKSPPVKDEPADLNLIPPASGDKPEKPAAETPSGINEVPAQPAKPDEKDPTTPTPNIEAPKPVEPANPIEAPKPIETPTSPAPINPAPPTPEAPLPASGGLNLTPTPTPTPQPTSETPTGTLYPIPFSGPKRAANAEAIDPAASVPAVASEPRRLADSGEPVTHVVQRGENFFSISQRYYATGRWYLALWDANKDVAKTPEDLYVGTEIRIPAPEKLRRDLIVSSKGKKGNTGLQPFGDANPTKDVQASRASRRSDGAKLFDVGDSIDPLPSASSRPSNAGSVAARPARYYTVKNSYETLRSIANRELGDSTRENEILDLNREELEGESKLAVGMKLKLPPTTTRQ